MIRHYAASYFWGNDSKIDEEKAVYMTCYAIYQDVNSINTTYPYHGDIIEFFIGKELQEVTGKKYFLQENFQTGLLRVESIWTVT